MEVVNTDSAVLDMNFLLLLVALIVEVALALLDSSSGMSRIRYET